MRLSFSLLVLLVASVPAQAQDQPPPPAEPAAPPAEAAPILDVTPADTHSARREALFELAFNALVEGNLELAERAFSEAAALPGDPAQSAVADSFVERVQRLRARRPRRAAVATSATVETSVAPGPRRSTVKGERLALLGTSTALGLGLYGWTVPGVLGVEANKSAGAFVGVYMLTAAGSFILPQLLISDRVSPGQANLAFYGGTRGIWQGVLVGALLAGELDPDHHWRGWEASMLLGSLGGLIGGYHLARATDMTAGEARTMAAVGDLGLAMGFGAGFLLRFDGEPLVCPVDSENPGCFGFNPQADSQARKMAAAGLLGSGLGLVGGYVLGKHRDHTWGDGEVLRGATLLGIWSAWGLVEAGGTTVSLDNRPFTASLMAGGALGLLAGDRLVRRTDFSVGQAILVDLGTISGGLVGAGATWLIAGDDAERPFVIASALGAIGGFAWTYWMFRDRPEGPAARSLSRLSRRGLAVIPTAGSQGHRGLAVAGLF